MKVNVGVGGIGGVGVVDSVMDSVIVGSSVKVELSDGNEYVALGGSVNVTVGVGKLSVIVDSSLWDSVGEPIGVKVNDILIVGSSENDSVRIRVTVRVLVRDGVSGGVLLFVSVSEMLADIVISSLKLSLVVMVRCENDAVALMSLDKLSEMLSRDKECDAVAVGSSLSEMLGEKRVSLMVKDSVGSSLKLEEMLSDGVLVAPLAGNAKKILAAKMTRLIAWINIIGGLAILLVLLSRYYLARKENERVSRMNAEDQDDKAFRRKLHLVRGRHDVRAG